MNNNSQLFSYIDNTVLKLNEGILPEKQTKKFLKDLEEELFKNSDGFEFVEQLNILNFPYWKNLIFKSKEDINRGLLFISKSNSFSHKSFLFDFLLDEFLISSDELKTKFYNTNLVTIRQDRASPVANNIVCFNHKFLHHFDENKTFHNLPGLFLMQYQNNPDFNKFEDICKDIKKTLNLNHDQFS